ncbi:hypothetical protein UFOVP181_274 [uncultured Caudovirales phage]|uniref:Uncharacterized protein n=1 Tax=uncultured Caudovirales phage TaxID=2100421 RepID=A0A6J5KU68_9CAUD|nr:hypothetical protein UFOVP57_365 [uncultured Caudovirales phage]CAB5208978.1 hypothetical protein UFOVP181_274 [uncultured Caudovirales phage]
MHDEMQPQNPEMNNLPSGEPDHEGAMARADLYKLANYSLKLFKQMEDNAQLESWVQAKITKAADYIASVYHYLEYEMKFSNYAHHLDNSDTLSESQKAEIKNKLMEAKSKVSELKKAQAEKQTGVKKIKEEVSKDACDAQPNDDFDEKIGETMSGAKEDVCPTCHGTGHIDKPERKVPEALKAKVKAYNRKAKAMSAAVKRVDANKNGIPDDMEDKEVEEDFEGLNKAGDTAKTSKGGTVTKTSTGIRHTPDSSKFTDEPHTEPASQAKSKSAAEKKAEKEKDVKLPKHPKDKTWGMKGGEKFGQGIPKAKKEKEVDETYGQGVYEAKKGDGNLANNAKPYDKVTRGDVIAGRLGKDEKGGKDKKVKEALKGDQKKLDVDGDKKIEKSDLAALRASKKVDEAKKGDDVADKAEKMRIAKGTGTGIKGAIKDVVSGLKGEKPAHTNEALAESTDLDRIKQFLNRLNG